MKRWKDLSEDEQQKAVGKATAQLLDVVVEGSIRFNDDLNHDSLQTDIDTAIKEANGNRTPWFAGEYVMEAVGDTLRSMAQCDAEDSYYPEVGESIIRL